MGRKGGWGPPCPGQQVAAEPCSGSPLCPQCPMTHSSTLGKSFPEWDFPAAMGWCPGLVTRAGPCSPSPFFRGRNGRNCSGTARTLFRPSLSRPLGSKVSRPLGSLVGSVGTGRPRERQPGPGIPIVARWGAGHFLA